MKINFQGEKLNRSEMSIILGGEGPSLARCQRLIRRSDRHRERGDLEGAARLIQKFEDIGCADTTFEV